MYTVNHGVCSITQDADVILNARKKILLAASAMILATASVFPTISEANRFSPEAIEARMQAEATNESANSRFSASAIEERMAQMASGEVEEGIPAVDMPSYEDIKRAVSMARSGVEIDESHSDLDRSLRASVEEVEEAVGINIVGTMRNYTGFERQPAVTASKSEFIEIPPDQLSAEMLHVSGDFYQYAAQVNLDRDVVAAVSHIAGWEVNLKALPDDTQFYVAYDDAIKQRNALEMIHSLTIVSNDNVLFSATKYADMNGKSGYYNPLGMPIREAVLDVAPVEGFHAGGVRMSSNFGPRVHPVTGRQSNHNGIDFAAPTGTPITAAGDGVVTMRGGSPTAGNFVVIEHDNNAVTVYMHMHRFEQGLSQGSRVSQGDVIGQVGSTGRSTGPHLHFEYRLPVGKNNQGDMLYAATDPIQATPNDAFMDFAKTNQFVQRQQELSVALNMPDDLRLALNPLPDRNSGSIATRTVQNWCDDSKLRDQSVVSCTPKEDLGDDLSAPRKVSNSPSLG